MATKGTKERAPKGMAKGIVAKAMTAHPKWTAKQIAEKYPVGESTAHKYMKQIRDELDKPRRIYEKAKDEERETAKKMSDLAENLLTPDEMQELMAGSYEPSRDELKSNRWLVFAGIVAGVALMLMFVIADRGIN